MFYKGTKKQTYILWVVSTCITFIFFMAFIYFSYFTAKELLIHAVISEREYAATGYQQYSYYECQKPNSWEIQQYIISDEAKIWEEFMFDSNYQKNKNISPEMRELAMKKCLHEVIEKSNIKRDVDFQRNLTKYSLAMFFFLVLFLAFAIQSERIYKKMK